MTDQPPLLNAPAPWSLRGRGYISVLRYAEQMTDQEQFLPSVLHGKRKQSAFCYMMFVDYADSPVGPYHELLYIPGAYRFPDGKDYLTISQIFVSSMDSVVNGIHNWGIPKQLAEFDVQYARGGRDHIRVSQDGACFAQLQYRSWPLAVPVPGSFVPASWRSLAQYTDGKSMAYSPSANGLACPAKLLEAKFSAERFPSLKQSNALLSVKLPYFRMRFPQARMLANERSEFLPSNLNF